MDITFPLNEEDLLPYLPRYNKVVIRIFKNKIWFCGRLAELAFRDAKFKIRVEPMTQFHRNPSNLDPKDHNEPLVTMKDIVIDKTYSTRWHPFSPENPEIIKGVVKSGSDQEDIMVIQFPDGVAVLSKRDCDIEAVEELLGRAERADISRANSSGNGLHSHNRT